LNKNDHTNSVENSSLDKPEMISRVRPTDQFLNIGIVGAGAFADFAIQSFLQVQGVRIVAVTDINEAAAINMANKNKAIFFTDLPSFLESERIDLVYIATPPFLHYQQSKAALLAGKHVICEKPASLNSKEAEELVDLASSKNLLYVVNLMQRYNPLYEIVHTIIKEKILGNFLHGYFENYASDENLGKDHWFWNETKGGGIFIEHGVHFFDMFAGWLGNGQVLNACELHRPSDKKITDRVQATVLYNDAVVNFYHGFDQPKILDRQEMRLLFELGEITLYEWIPVKMKLHGLLKYDQLKWLKAKLPGSEIIYNGEAQPKNNRVRGRFVEIHFDKEVTLTYGNAADKQGCYSRLLTNMLTDQWNWIKDQRHKRIIDGANAVESLRIAEEAHRIAQNINY
jgi:predicted dehydrogenase